MVVTVAMLEGELGEEEKRQSSRVMNAGLL
jgi:hypothetical protein